MTETITPEQLKGKKWRTTRSSNKYGAKKVRIGRYVFDSKLEARRYEQLKLLLAAEEIDQLKVHPRYKLECWEQDICTVVLDFEYWDCRIKQRVFEDAKGFYTPMSKLHHKLWEMFSPYCAKIKIVTEKDVGK